MDGLHVYYQNENTSVCMCVYVCTSVPNHMLYMLLCPSQGLLWSLENSFNKSESANLPN